MPHSPLPRCMRTEHTDTQVLVRVTHAGVNGGCETFRARGEHWFERNREATDGFALGAEGASALPEAPQGHSQPPLYLT